MKLIKTLCFLLLFSGIMPCQAQNKILLLNGKEIDAESYTVGELFVTYRKSGDKRSGTRAVDYFDVFSITRNGGEEQVLYKPIDTLDLSIEEARLYIKGEQAAHQYFHCPGVNISSAVVGAGSSILSFYSLPVPMLYSVVMGRFNPKHYDLPDDFDKGMASNEAFRLGYEKAARNLKIQRSLKWGYIGLGAGLAGFLIYGASSR